MKPRYATAACVIAMTVLVLAGFCAPHALWVVAALLGVLFAAGWPALLGLPARKSLFPLIAACSVLASFLLAHRLGRISATERLGLALLVVAFGVCGVFVIQLVRGNTRPYRLESTMGGAAAILIACLGAAWVGLAGISSDKLNLDFPWLALCAGVSLVLTTVISSLNLRRSKPGAGGSRLNNDAAPRTSAAPASTAPLTDSPVLNLFALVLGTGAATAVAAWAGSTPWTVALAVGLLSSLIVLAWRKLTMSAPPERWGGHGKARLGLLAKLSLGVAPVLLCGPVITSMLVITAR